MHAIAAWVALVLPAPAHPLAPAPPPSRPHMGATHRCDAACRVVRIQRSIHVRRRAAVALAVRSYLPAPRRAHFSDRAGAAVREWWFWGRTLERFRRLAALPLSRRIPRWTAWMCIAEHESGRHWAMSPTSSPASGGRYWGGLQMDVSFQRTYGRDMLRRHRGGLANTWRPVEQIVVANRAFRTRGFSPWRSTAARCGLL